MTPLDVRITSWMQRNVGATCTTVFVGVGLYPWKCYVRSATGAKLARGTGTDETRARRSAFIRLVNYTLREKEKS